MGNRKHYVLQSKATGKQASRADQAMLANKLKAREISTAGQGGGIADLLLPRTPKEKAALQKVEKLYDVVQVTKRAGGERAQAREEVEKEHFLIVALAELYSKSGGHGQHQRETVKNLTEWICGELKNYRTEVCKLIFRHSPALADRQTPDWWQKRIALRRKQLKAQDANKVKTES
jgi:hypothetical protein